MLRRTFLQSLITPLINPPADFTLRIQPVTVELSPKVRIRTTGYNGALRRELRQSSSGTVAVR